MKKNIFVVGIYTLMIAGTFSCKQVPSENVIEESWNFDNADGWGFYHQDTATIEQWSINNGILELSTRAHTYDRTKMATLDKDYAAGVYKWRTFIPEVAPGEQVSIGSWIYCDDQHELDFEVGYGSAAMREDANAQPGEMVAAMTNQAFPYKSGNVAVIPGWHDFEIRLDVDADGKYIAIWSIDNVEKQRLSLDFGPEVGFAIHCSVENLKFIGDTIPQSNYTGLYDYVSFRGTKVVENK